MNAPSEHEVCRHHSDLMMEIGRVIEGQEQAIKRLDRIEGKMNGGLPPNISGAKAFTAGTRAGALGVGAGIGGGIIMALKWILEVIDK